jgi:hypothetical protein
MEKDRLALLTGVNTDNITSTESLNRFVERNKSMHRNGTLEGRLISALLDDEKIQD